MVNPNKTLYTRAYTVGQVPQSLNEIPAWLQQELERIQIAMQLIKTGAMDPTTVAPTKPRKGLAVYALGAPYWDPGSGEGMYYYNSVGIWKFLG